MTKAEADHVLQHLPPGWTGEAEKGADGEWTLMLALERPGRLRTTHLVTDLAILRQSLKAFRSLPLLRINHSIHKVPTGEVIYIQYWHGPYSLWEVARLRESFPGEFTISEYASDYDFYDLDFSYSLLTGQDEDLDSLYAIVSQVEQDHDDVCTVVRDDDGAYRWETFFGVEEESLAHLRYQTLDELLEVSIPIMDELVAREEEEEGSSE